MSITCTHPVLHSTCRGIARQGNELLHCPGVVAERVGKAVHLVSEDLFQDVFATHDLIVRYALPEGIELRMSMSMTTTLYTCLVHLDYLLPGEHWAYCLSLTA